MRHTYEGDCSVSKYQTMPGHQPDRHLYQSIGLQGTQQNVSTNARAQLGDFGVH